MPRLFPHQWLVFYLSGLNQYTAFLNFFLFALYGFLLTVSILIFESILSHSEEPSIKAFLEVAARDAHADDGE